MRIRLLVFVVASALAACAKPPPPSAGAKEEGKSSGGETGGGNRGETGGGNNAPDPGDLQGEKRPVEEPKGGNTKNGHKDRTVRWAASSGCTETCERLEECGLGNARCKATCDSSEEDEVTHSTYTCFAAAHDCNEMLNCR